MDTKEDLTVNKDKLNSLCQDVIDDYKKNLLIFNQDLNNKLTGVTGTSKCNHSTITGATGPTGVCRNTTYYTDNLTSASANIGPSNKLFLRGDDADIDINGVGLMSILNGIQDRLNILSPNHKLESEWEELADLGRKYRELEKALKEKAKMWDILSK